MSGSVLGSDIRLSDIIFFVFFQSILTETEVMDLKLCYNVYLYLSLNM